MRKNQQLQKQARPGERAIRGDLKGPSVVGQPGSIRRPDPAKGDPGDRSESLASEIEGEGEK